MAIQGAINTGIDYSQSFEQWEALVEVGASLNEILKWESGEYPIWFMARVIAWYRGHRQVSNHVDDAVAKAQEAKAKKGKRRR